MIEGELINHAALTESFYKDIPKLSASRIASVSRNFGFADVSDFEPDGDRAGKSVPWQTISKAVLARDNYECRICGKSTLAQVDSSADFRKIHFELEVHHIIPRKDGGIDNFRNLITLCEDCHHKTFSEGYAGIPVDKNLDLFSFEKRFYFALPPDEPSSSYEETRTATVDDFSRVFDQSENRYRVIPLQNSKLRVNVAPVRLEDYRKVVSKLIHMHEIKDYVTLNVHVAGTSTKARFLVDSSGDLIV